MIARGSKRTLKIYGKATRQDDLKQYSKCPTQQVDRLLCESSARRECARRVRSRGSWHYRINWCKPSAMPTRARNATTSQSRVLNSFIRVLFMDLSSLIREKNTRYGDLKLYSKAPRPAICGLVKSNFLAIPTVFVLPRRLVLLSSVPRNDT